ncbi:MAG: peptidoglycan-binding protein [Pseudomonadota bacterium]
MRQFIGAIFCIVWLAGVVRAQSIPNDSYWVQLQSIPTQTEAIVQAQTYNQQFDNVMGFTIGGGWRALALGPYDRATAFAELERLKQSNQVPADSFVANGTSYREMVWPVPGAVTRTPTTAPVQADTSVDAQTSEAALTRDEKRVLQSALAWSGHYDGAIDGLFGRGTRAAMRKWQTAQGADPTGLLPPDQRETLLQAYNAVFDGLGLQTVDHTQAGIQIEVPLNMVETAAISAPFVRYDAKEDRGISLILISQTGDTERLSALYKVLQTLDIIPENGDRSLGRRGFTIEGIDESRHTSTFVRLENDHIKGAILIWPTGDDDRRVRVKDRIFASFAQTDGVLPEAYFLKSGQTADDMVAGLAVRQPQFTRSGVFVDTTGHILTAAQGLVECARIDMGDDAPLIILGQDDHLALLAPTRPQTPGGLPAFQEGDVPHPLPITVSGYSYGGLLPGASLTLGQLQDVKDLTGNIETWRLTIDTQPGDIGGPVLGPNGGVLAILLPPALVQTPVLPKGVTFARRWATAAPLLQSAGITPQIADQMDDMHMEDLTTKVQDFTALIRCWE